MRRLRVMLTIAAHDVGVALSERGVLAARLVIPIAFILVVGVANDAFQSAESARPVIDLVDLDGSELSSLYLDRVAASGYETRRLDEQADGEVIVIVPAGFEEALLSGGAAVRLVQAVNDPQEAMRLRALLEQADQRLALVVRAGDAAWDLSVSGSEAPQARVVADEAARRARARAVELLAEERVALSEEAIELPGRLPLVGLQQSVPGMGSMFAMLGVLAGASLLVEERRRWTLQRTLCGPVGRAGMLAGRLLGRFAVGMLQYLVAIATGLAIGAATGVGFGRSPLVMAAVMGAFVLCLAAMCVLIAAVVRREQQAAGLSTLLAVTLAPIGGAWWSLDIELVPDVMRRVAVVSPFYWVMEGFRVAVHDLGWIEALLPIGVLLGLTAAIFAAAAFLSGRLLEA